MVGVFFLVVDFEAGFFVEALHVVLLLPDFRAKSCQHSKHSSIL